MKSVIGYATIVLILISLFTGCSTAMQNTAATPQQSTRATPLAGIKIPDLVSGEQAWNTQQCNACHGPIALGGIGPAVAATSLEFKDFLKVVRTAMPPKPAYPQDVLSDDMAYNIYAWVRTQQPYAAPSVPTELPLPTFEAATPEDALGMTIWTSHHCNSCHGVFAQGGAKAPALAGLNYPVDEELTRLRNVSGDIPQHRPDNIDDDTFTHLYKWLQAGCGYTKDCAQ